MLEVKATTYYQFLYTHITQLEVYWKQGDVKTFICSLPDKAFAPTELTQDPEALINIVHSLERVGNRVYGESLDKFIIQEFTKKLLQDEDLKRFIDRLSRENNND